MAHENYEFFNPAGNTLELLQAIKGEMTGVNTTAYEPHALHQVIFDFYHLHQGKTRTNQEYYEDFTTLVAAAEDAGANFTRHLGLVSQVLLEMVPDDRAATTDERKRAMATARERYLATAFLLGSDRSRYGTLVEDIRNRYAQAKRINGIKLSTYPDTVAEAFEVLNNYRRDIRNITRLFNNDNTSIGAAFTQQDDDTAAGQPPNQLQHDGTVNESKGTAFLQQNHITCNRCGRKGHTSIECRTASDIVEKYQAGDEFKAKYPKKFKLNQKGVSQLIVDDIEWDQPNSDNNDPSFGFLMACTEHFPDRGC